MGKGSRKGGCWLVSDRPQLSVCNEPPPLLRRLDLPQPSLRCVSGGLLIIGLEANRRHCRSSPANRPDNRTVLDDCSRRVL